MDSSFVLISLSILVSVAYGHYAWQDQELKGKMTEVVREFYVGAVEREWDYAPSGMNNAKGIALSQDSDAPTFVTKGNTTIGRVYKKVLYREFTDTTFKTEKPHPEHLGMLGPILYGEVGETIKVHFKNMASKRKYSMHPHGVFYAKSSEGAVYQDGRNAADKLGDQVEPGAVHTYTWQIKPSHAPLDSDEECLTWVYHSHVDPVKDTNTGLIGPMLTCKKGILDASGKRKDVDKDFFALFSVIDENQSWLLDENINQYCGDPSKAMTMKEDEDFKEANKMHSINGFFYGNLLGLDFCLGDKVRWYLFGLGTEVDIHTAFFHGQTIKVDSHRKDVASLLPATFVTATMTTNNPGTWLLNCVVTDHYAAGMYALFNVTKCKNKNFQRPSVNGGVTRTYYITAEEVIWDYGPSGENKFKGGNLTDTGSDSAVFFDQGDLRIGGRYKKALYFEYTNRSFTVRKTKASHLGFLGPIIRGEVGDTIKVVFKNLASRNYSIQPHGVFVSKDNEGALYHDFTSGRYKRDDIVQPNTTHEYVWRIPELVGPTREDAQCLTYVYQSAVDPIKDMYSGLIGPVLVCKKGALNDTGYQNSVDKEFVLLFIVSDESSSWYHEENKNKFCGTPDQVDNNDESYKESNKMHGINGLLYANLEGLRMCKGDKVSWHLIGLGNEVDMHTAAFNGQTLTLDSQRKDTVSLLPGSFATAYMEPDNEGEWALVCKTTDHYSAGMQAKFTVDECNKPAVSKLEERRTRTYYIAAVEKVWDYAPSGRHEMAGVPLQDNEQSKTFTERGDKRIGRKYKKAMYREYTDGTFTTEKERGNDTKHIGIMGPIIYAEVGDTIEVVFKNKATRDYSIHPHGVFYKKNMEGSDYKDGTKGDEKHDNKVAPGTEYRYKWTVPARAAPGPNDTNCIAWAYYSDVDAIKDPNTGLIGPLVICKKNILTSANKRADVDRDFALLFTVLDENKSWYLDDNIKKFCGKPDTVDKEDDGFKESNLMHGINGYVFGNLHGLEMTAGEKVDWYLVGLGNEVDLHTVHFHGQTFVTKASSYHREDVYDLFPGVFATLQMIPDNTGNWLLHCHVNDHKDGGMETLFTVRPEHKKSTETPKPSNSPTLNNSIVVFLLVSCLVGHFLSLL